MNGGGDLLELACAARRDYVPHSAAMLHSVLVGAERPVRIHYLHGDDMPESYRVRLTRMVEDNGGRVSFHRVSGEQVAGLRTPPFLPASHWYRIFLPQLLPEVDRILYLDADTIVVDSLEPLWWLALGEKYLAAVTNVFQPNHFDRPADLGLPGRDAYFNSGVMVMNLELMRRDDVVSDLLEYALAHHHAIAWGEQDTLNVILGDRRLPLHPRWNLMTSILDFPWSAETFGAEVVEEAKLNPAIRHFEGPGVNKPWHLLCERDMRDLYREHRRQTPWPRFLPAGVTPANLARWARRELRRR